MNSKSLNRLAIAAAVLLVAAWLANRSEGAGRVGFTRGMVLIQGFEPSRIESVSISAKDKAVTLTKMGERFVIEEKYRYPASMAKLNELIRKCTDITLREELTSEPIRHAALGVTEGGPDAVTVIFRDVAGKTLAGIVMGKAAEGIEGSGPKVRRVDQDAVYLAERPLMLQTDPSEYLERDLFALSKEMVAGVTVTRKNEKPYEISANEEGVLALQGIPAGQQAKGKDFESVAGALVGLRVDDVTPAASVKVEWEADYTCRLTNGITYSVQLGKEGENHYLRVTAEPVPAAMLEDARRVGKTEETEKLEVKSKIIAAVTDQLDKVFNEKHKDWVYTISSWKAGALTKSFEELVEKMPDPENPEEISASHILFDYAGAEGSKSSRSKEEAKATAERVLKEINESGADFGTLAKSNSSCPSAEKNGDLGSFKKGTMHTNFDSAAWNLKVSEISGIVETPFGFHIITRTK